MINYKTNKLKVLDQVGHILDILDKGQLLYPRVLDQVGHIFDNHLKTHFFIFNYFKNIKTHK